MEMVNMEEFNDALEGLSVTHIAAKNKLKIRLATLEYDLEPGQKISICAERKNNEKLDAICRATKPEGERPDEYINLSRVEWYCSKGGSIVIDYEDEEIDEDFKRFCSLFLQV